MTENIDIIKPLVDPIILFSKWFKEASQKELNDPNAMCLSTISKNLVLSSRMVLLKDYNHDGFVFYTNSNSKKGQSIIYNPNVSLNFHWKSLLRQVRIEGEISCVSSEEADNYYNSRPKESRIGAWASNQSEELKNRKDLKEKIKFYEKKFQNETIKRPPHWKGYRVKPNLIEFWQDMPFRLHDRLEYKKKQNEWIARKLYP